MMQTLDVSGVTMVIFLDLRHDCPDLIGMSCSFDPGVLMIGWCVLEHTLAQLQLA
jgi:hypothetical protein